MIPQFLRANWREWDNGGDFIIDSAGPKVTSSISSRMAAIAKHASGRFRNLDSAAAADHVLLESTSIKYNPTGLGVATEDETTAMYQEFKAQDALNFLHTTETIYVRTNEIRPSEKPRMVMDATVLLRAHMEAIRKRSPVATDGIYVVPVLNQHGVPVAVISSFDANAACDSCDCGQPVGYVYAKMVQSLKLFSVAIGLATTATSATARDLRRKSMFVNKLRHSRTCKSGESGEVREIPSEIPVEPVEPEAAMAYNKALLRGFQDQRRRVALKIIMKKGVVRTSLGEIKRYRKPPGIIANIVVALLICVGDVDVINAVRGIEEELGDDVISWRGLVERKRKTSKDEELEVLNTAWDTLWHVARRQVQLQYQHPNFILRRMEQMSRDVTSTNLTRAEYALSIVSIEHLNTLLEGVSVKKVRKASEVAAIVCKWVTAHMHILESLRKIKTTSESGIEQQQQQQQQHL